MTPWEEVPLLEGATVEQVRVRDLLEIFEGTGVTHLVVA